MEYEKLEKPIYWMGWQKGKFTKRKFVERQIPFPRYLRAEDGEVRFFSKVCEKRMGEVQYVGGYSKYSYVGFTELDEIEFLKAIIERNEARIRQEQKKIDLIHRETDKIIEVIKEKEKDVNN